MGKPQLDIRIGADGKVKLDVSGVSGSECIALTDLLKQIIGHEESRELTGEYYGAGGQVRRTGEVRGRVGG